jgi:hypothetical protein
MSVQDRNVHKDAFLHRKEIPVALVTPTGTDEDEIQFALKPRHNFRLTDLLAFARSVATTGSRVRACIGKELCAIGAPQFGAAAAVTFTIEAFTQLDAGVFTAVGATAAQAFTAAFTVSDGYWGVVTVQIDGSQTITTKAAASVMAFPDEATAIRNAPTPDALNGLVGVLTIEASGADFDATADNTSTANSFNTVDRGGHYLDLGVLATDQVQQATRSSYLKVAGVGNLVGEKDDLIVVTVRSAGTSTLGGAVAVPEYRHAPSQGEGFEAGTGLTGAFVP